VRLKRQSSALGCAGARNQAFSRFHSEGGGSRGSCSWSAAHRTAPDALDDGLGQIRCRRIAVVPEARGGLSWCRSIAAAAGFRSPGNRSGPGSRTPQADSRNLSEVFLHCGGGLPLRFGVWMWERVSVIQLAVDRPLQALRCEVWPRRQIEAAGACFNFERGDCEAGRPNGCRNR